ncbi:MAG: rhodanese-like domain-containing protein, partial [Polaribacter sp.]
MKQIFFFFISALLLLNCSKQEDVKSISTKELKTLLGKEKIQLVDVRTPKEIQDGFIKTALFSNYFD